jgi:hypothetical protein
MNRNSILLRRRNKVIVPRGDGSLPLSYAATINKNLESLGYTLSKNVLEALATLSLDDAARFYEEVVAILKEARGVRDYEPMYPNFPRQVMEATTAELYINAVLHYLTAWVADVGGGGRGKFIWLPDYEKKPREPLKDGVRLTVIELGTEDDLHRIFSSVISSKASISETDREELKWYLQNYMPDLPESIPNKEVLAFVGALIPDSPALKKYVKTATDVLRLAVAMSGGDVSLAVSRGEKEKLCSNSWRTATTPPRTCSVGRAAGSGSARGYIRANTGTASRRRQTALTSCETMRLSQLSTQKSRTPSGAGTFARLLTCFATGQEILPAAWTIC